MTDLLIRDEPPWSPCACDHTFEEHDGLTKACTKCECPEFLPATGDGTSDVD